VNDLEMDKCSTCGHNKLMCLQGPDIVRCMQICCNDGKTDKWDQPWARCPRSTCNGPLYKRKCKSKACGWEAEEILAADEVVD